MGRGGLLSLPVSGETNPDPAEGEGRGKETVTADSKTSTRHGPPATPPSSSKVDVLCKKILGKCDPITNILNEQYTSSFRMSHFLYILWINVELTFAPKNLLPACLLILSSSTGVSPNLR